jgi:hypothetical protein
MTVAPVQAAVLKDYPNSMIVTVAQCMFSTVQSFIVAVIAERDFSRWKLRFDFSLLAILYNVCSAFIFLFLSVENDRRSHLTVGGSRTYILRGACVQITYQI